MYFNIRVTMSYQWQPAAVQQQSAATSPITLPRALSPSSRTLSTSSVDLPQDIAECLLKLEEALIAKDNRVANRYNSHPYILLYLSICLCICTSLYSFVFIYLSIYIWTIYPFFVCLSFVLSISLFIGSLSHLCILQVLFNMQSYMSRLMLRALDLPLADITLIRVSEPLVQLLGQRLAHIEIPMLPVALDVLALLLLQGTDVVRLLFFVVVIVDMCSDENVTCVAAHELAVPVLDIMRHDGSPVNVVRAASSVLAKLSRGMYG